MLFFSTDTKHYVWRGNLTCKTWICLIHPNIWLSFLKKPEPQAGFSSISSYYAFRTQPVQLSCGGWTSLSSPVGKETESICLAAEAGTWQGNLPLSPYQTVVTCCHQHNRLVMAYKRLVFLGLFTLALELIMSPFSLPSSVELPDLHALKNEWFQLKIKKDWDIFWELLILGVWVVKNIWLLLPLWFIWSMKQLSIGLL